MNTLRTLTVQNADGSIEQYRTNDAHPFYVEGLGWTNADVLKTGDVLTTPNGPQATLIATRLDFHPETLTVYNFEVAGSHSYFVLDGQGAETTPVWVHNVEVEGGDVCRPGKNFI